VWQGPPEVPPNITKPAARASPLNPKATSRAKAIPSVMSPFVPLVFVCAMVFIAFLLLGSLARLTLRCNQQCL
jgi:hypothetical protein